MKSKVLLLALLAQIFALSASAYDAYVGGIYYNLDTTDKTAFVTYRDENYNSYSLANIVVPSEITYNSSNYKVTIIDGSAFKSFS